MRNVLLAASAIAACAIPGAASAQYYSSQTYVTPPAYVAPAPMVQAPVYMAPTVTVTPGAVYDDQAIYINGERYYRDCWWDWGHRRCELKHWW